MAVYTAGNVTARLILSRFPPSLGTALHQDNNALHLRMERTRVAAGAPSRDLAAHSSEKSEGRGQGPPASGGRIWGQGGGLWNVRAGLRSSVVQNGQLMRPLTPPALS